MSHRDRYQVVVDTDAWKGSRVQLSGKVAAVVGTSVARARAILDVAGHPIAEFGDPDMAQRLATALREVGVDVDVRHRTIRGAAIDEIASRSGRYVSPSARTDVAGVIDHRTQRPGWSGAFGVRTPQRQAQGGTVVGLPGFDDQGRLEDTFAAGVMEPPAAATADTIAPATADTIAPAGTVPAALVSPDRNTPGSAWADILGEALDERLASGEARRDSPAAPVRATVSAPLPDAVDAAEAGEVDSDPDDGDTADVPWVGDSTSPPSRIDDTLVVAPPGDTLVEGVESARTLGPREAREAVAAAQRDRGDSGDRVDGSGRGERVAMPQVEVRPPDGGEGADAQRPAPKRPATPLDDIEVVSVRSTVPPQASIEPPPVEPLPVLLPGAPQPAGDVGAAGASVGDRFQMMRRETPMAATAIGPTPEGAAFWGVLAPGAGFAYLGESSRGVIYALGAPFLVPWVVGAFAAMADAKEIQAGRRLAARRSSPLGNLAYVLAFWSLVGLAVGGLCWVSVATVQERPPPVAESVDSGPSVDVTTTLIGDRPTEESEHETDEVAGVLAREEEFSELIRRARVACGSERWVECRELAGHALDLDEQSREAQTLHVRAVSHGVIVPTAPPGGTETSP